MRVAIHDPVRAAVGDPAQDRELLAYTKTIAPRVSDQALKLRTDKYALAVGVAVANLSVQEEKLRKAHTAWEQAANGGEEPETPMSEAQIRRALTRRLAACWR